MHSEKASSPISSPLTPCFSASWMALLSFSSYWPMALAYWPRLASEMLYMPCRHSSLKRATTSFWMVCRNTLALEEALKMSASLAPVSCSSPNLSMYLRTLRSKSKS